MLTIDNIIYDLRNNGNKRIPEEKIAEVETAYEIACDIHKNQFRESGEPYIIHPLNVANNLLKMEIYDPDAIAAALLHDTIEDAEESFTKEDVAELINPTVAELVDGVTKISGMDYSNKQDIIIANKRKITTALTNDIRIIYIKFADRLHNMSTLEFKRPEKQIDNARETMDLYVPLAKKLGAYQIKNQLEDISLKYLDPEAYKRITDSMKELETKETNRLKVMASVIRNDLDNKDIDNDIVFRTQSKNTIYKKMQADFKMENIFDLFYFKILVPTTEDCYRTLYVVHRNYTPINGRFKDYITNPKDETYQSLHTTVCTEEELSELLASMLAGYVKIKIRTFDMDKLAAHGYSAFWNFKDEEKGKTPEETQKYIREKSMFINKIKEYDKNAKNDREYEERLEKDVLSEHVYVYTASGIKVELPKGSTAIDFVLQLFPNEVDRMSGIMINGKKVEKDKKLKNNDVVHIIVNGKINPEDWIESNGYQKIK